MRWLEKEEDLFFVEVLEPADVRKDILESQKIVIGGLQRYENIKFLRAKKAESINKLKGELKKLAKELSELKTVLPSAGIKVISRPRKKAKVVKNEQAKEEKKVNRMPASELEKLESELQDIEKKLSSL